MFFQSARGSDNDRSKVCTADRDCKRSVGTSPGRNSVFNLFRVEDLSRRRESLFLVCGGSSVIALGKLNAYKGSTNREKNIILSNCQ